MAETALDFLDDGPRARVRIADAPIVEGAVAAAVAARTGGDLDAVEAAARTAAGSTAPVDTVDTGAPGPGTPVAVASPADSAVVRRVTLINPSGLHARPAAEFVKTASRFDARITVQGVDAKSLLRIMALGLGAGTELELTAEGAEAAPALDALVALVDSGFGE